MFDRGRLEQILSTDYGYYTGPEPDEKIDNRLHPSTADLIRSCLRSELDALDIGCGNGATLMAHVAQMRMGVGIDNDPDHVKLAARNLQASGIGNVSFEQLGFDRLGTRGWDERFDLAFSERGPVGYSVGSVLTALSVLRPGACC